MAQKKVRVAIIGVGNCASALVPRSRLTVNGAAHLPIFSRRPKQFRDDICREKVEAFIKAESNE